MRKRLGDFGSSAAGMMVDWARYSFLIRHMDYKTLYIIDTVKYERLQLAKFLKQENFTIMSFLNLADCFKKPLPLRTDLIINVIRKGDADLKNLERVKKKDRAIHMILVIMTPDTPVDLEHYREMGYENLHLATNNEKVREITYGLLAPDGLKPRTETPHPIPLPYTA